MRRGRDGKRNVENSARQTCDCILSLQLGAFVEFPISRIRQISGSLMSTGKRSISATLCFIVIIFCARIRNAASDGVKDLYTSGLELKRFLNRIKISSSFRKVEVRIYSSIWLALIRPYVYLKKSIYSVVFNFLK